MMAESTLLRAIERGDAELLGRVLDSGRPMNFCPRFRGSALSIALAQPTPDRAVIELLVRRGCAMFTPDEDGETPLEVARRRGLDDLADWMCEPSHHGGPTWHRDFVAAQGPVIVVMLRKGGGFGFDADDIERPFRVGGEYMGHGYEADRAQGMAELHRLLQTWPDLLAWFVPFAEMITDGRDFSLKEFVEEHGHRCYAVHW